MVGGRLLGVEKYDFGAFLSFAAGIYINLSNCFFSVSFQPFKVPYCTKDGVVFDLE